MANRYRFNIKKPIGKINKLSDTLFAENIKESCFKLADLIDHKICDKEYSYFCNQVDKATSGTSSNYALLCFDYGDEFVEAFIEKVNDSILKG